MPRIRSAVGSQAVLSTTFAGISGPGVDCKGDSLTAGVGATGPTSYPSVLQNLISAAYTSPGTVRNEGVGGETSSTIAGRTGTGLPWLATVAGGQIPASGGVIVTLISADGSTVAPLLQGAVGINPCKIAGITGTLSLNAGVYTFTRTTAGNGPVAAMRPVAITTDAAANRSGDLAVYWWGTNDGTTDATALIARIQASERELAAGRRRHLVLGLSTGADTDRTTMDAQLQAAFGRRFLNIRKYLSSSAALFDSGIAPTVADSSAISAGSVPPSLLNNYPTDTTHLNATGYAQVAKAVLERISELGWDDRWGTKASASPGPLPFIMAEDFVRPDGTSILSTATQYGGKLWNAAGDGTATTSGGALALGVVTNEMFTVADAGVTDFHAQAVLRTPGADGRAFFVMNFQNNINLLFLDGNGPSGHYRLRNRVANVTTDVGPDLAVSPTAGDVLDVTRTGTTVIVKINSTERFNGTVPAAVAGGTNFGFWSITSAAASRWESLLLR